MASSGYRARGGLHPETAALANVLANIGVPSGLTGRPLTEAAILGIGGGLGAGYILWEFKSHREAILTYCRSSVHRPARMAGPWHPAAALGGASGACGERSDSHGGY